MPTPLSESFFDVGDRVTLVYGKRHNTANFLAYPATSYPKGTVTLVKDSGIVYVQWDDAPNICPNPIRNFQLLKNPTL